MFQHGRRIGLVCAAALALALSATAAQGQQSAMHEVSVPFGPPTGGQGYTGGSIKVRYAFLRCDDAIFIAYGLVDGSAQASSTYLMNGKVVEARGAPPQPSTIRFSGTAQRAGAETIKSFTDGATGSALGFGCFSGQLQELGKTVAWLGPKPTSAQIINFLNSLTLKVNPAAPLRNASLEAQLNAEQRQAQAKAAEDQRVAEAKKQEDARAAQAAEAKKLADARQAEGAKAAAAAKTAAAQTSAPALARPAAPPVLTDAERADRAIQADRLLAQQRLEEQRAKLRKFNQQMADNEAIRQQQQQAVIGAAPQLAELGNMLQNWSDGIEQRQYQRAQQAMAGKCAVNGLPFPKDGELLFGVELSGNLSKNDCGDNWTNRYKAYALVVPQKAHVRISVRIPGIKFSQVQLNVRDLDNKTYFRLHWQDWGAIQKFNSAQGELPAGVYVVTVTNAAEGIYGPYVLRVDAWDSAGKVIAVAAPPAPMTPAIPQQVSSTAGDNSTSQPGIGAVGAQINTPAGRSAWLTPMPKIEGPLAPNRLGATVEAVDGKLMLRTLEGGGPLARAGLASGDRILSFSAIKPAFDPAASSDPVAGLEQWLADRPLATVFQVKYERAGANKATRWVFLRVRNEVGFTVEGSGGILIVKSIDPAGPAAKSGMQVGDQLTAIKAENGGITFDHAELSDGPAFEDWLTRQRPGVAAALEYRRGAMTKKAIIVMVARPYQPVGVLAAR